MKNQDKKPEIWKKLTKENFRFIVINRDAFLRDCCYQQFYENYFCHPEHKKYFRKRCWKCAFFMECNKPAVNVYTCQLYPIYLKWCEQNKLHPHYSYKKFRKYIENIETKVQQSIL